MNPKVLFLGLNEFNADLLEQGAQKLKLASLERLCSLHKSALWTNDTYESDFLEPWVQWVSVHTGVPSTEHKIKHLGDVPRLETKQIWERLSAQGISSGIWGAMNASRGDAPHCKFFVPDPWTASEQAYPQELNALLDPIRYVSKNYLNRSTKIFLQKISKLLGLVFSQGLGGVLLRELGALPWHLSQFGFHPFVFISLADYLSTRLFLKFRNAHKPDFSFLFLNSLAHLQHHHWHGVDFGPKEPLTYGLRFLDRIAKCLFDSMRENEIFLASNAFSQMNTNQEKPWILYRQIDQAAFLRAVGIQFSHVEPHMTHDAHILFENEAQAEAAKKSLESATIEKKPLFLVERYENEPNKLFYRICFTDRVDRKIRFTLGRNSYRFFDLFQAIVQRTGKHISEGTVYCSHDVLPSRMKNHELFSTLFFNRPLSKFALVGKIDGFSADFCAERRRHTQRVDDE